MNFSGKCQNLLFFFIKTYFPYKESIFYRKTESRREPILCAENDMLFLEIQGFIQYLLQMGLIYKVTDCVQSEKYAFDVEELS